MPSDAPHDAPPFSPMASMRADTQRRAAMSALESAGRGPKACNVTTSSRTRALDASGTVFVVRLKFMLGWVSSFVEVPIR